MPNWFRAREEKRAAGDLLLQALVGGDEMTRQKALEIPSVAECVEIITGTVSMLPVKLYRETAGAVREEVDDPRVALLNDEPGGLMDACQMKRAWVSDYLLEGAGYLYIERERNAVTGLRYVRRADVSAIVSPGPIYRTAELVVGGAKYREFEFVKLLRQSVDGMTGRGIVAQNETALAVAYNSLMFENFLVKTGGNKKGFLKAKKRLSEEALAKLKSEYKRLYSNGSGADNVIVLNDGLEFQESSSTSVEMQLNERKKTNSGELCKLFSTPPAILEGTASDEVYALWVKICLNPILAAMEAALNKDLLLESEKRERVYFAVDTKELLKGDLLKRFQAYQSAIASNIMSIDEARYREDLPPLGLDFIRLGLQDVLYNPRTKEIYTPNTGQNRQLDGEAGELGPKKEPAPSADDGEATTDEADEPEKIAQVSLNGAQIAGILQVVESVGAGVLERESALTLLTSAFPFSKETAEKILGHPKPPHEGGEQIEG